MFNIGIIGKARLVEKLLQNIHAFTTVSFDEERNEVHVYVDRGDWKHEHLAIVNLIRSATNPKACYEEVTEETDCDVYSSKHIFCY